MPALMRAVDNIEFENNVSTDTVRQNILHASQRDLEWLALLPETDQECLIVAGGPSLTADIEKVRKRHKAGAYILALNGAARFLNLHSIIPDALIVLDARPNKNNDFLRCETKKLFLASQCDKTLFDQFDPHHTVLFHIDTPNIGSYVPGKRQIQAIGGGANVGLIALSLAYTRGFRKLHLYGYDSSYQDNVHHAYTQTANDMDQAINAIAKGRTFKAAPWMIYQVEQFQILLPQLINLGCDVTVHGEGLLPFVAWHMTLPQQTASVLTQKEH